MLNALAGPSRITRTALLTATKTATTTAVPCSATRALHTTTTTSGSGARHRPWDPTHRADRSERSPRSFDRTNRDTERTPRPRPRATNTASSFGMRSTPLTDAELEYRRARKQVIDDAARPPPQLQQQASGYAAAVEAVTVAPAAPRYRSRRADRSVYGKKAGGARGATLAVDADDDGAVAEAASKSVEAEMTEEAAAPAARRRWEPTKKLTYAAMAGVRELHAQDPENWTRDALARQFGISYEAVSRILKSKFRARLEDKDVEKVEAMGKWASSGAGSVGDASPVPIIRKMYAAKRALEAEEAEEAAEAAAATAVGGKKWAAPLLPGAGAGAAAQGMSAAERAAAEAADVLESASREKEQERRRALRPGRELPELKRYLKE